MNRYLSAVKGFLGILVVSSGCQGMPATEPTFPEDGVRAVTTAEQFDTLVQQAKGGERGVIKLAGHVVSVDVTDQGAEVLAKWLPFPRQASLEEMPADPAGAQGREFVFLFPGTIRDPFTAGASYDPRAAWEGNPFLLEGTVSGTKTMVAEVFGEERSFLHVTARCVHVWESGESPPSDQPDSQWAGTVARTFCAAAALR